jgi:hypothetical protein
MMAGPDSALFISLRQSVAEVLAAEMGVALDDADVTHVGPVSQKGNAT